MLAAPGDRQETVANISCHNCAALVPVAPFDPPPARCPQCGRSLTDEQDDARRRSLQQLVETVAELRRARGSSRSDSDQRARVKALEKRFEVLASALSKSAGGSPSPAPR